MKNFLLSAAFLFVCAVVFAQEQTINKSFSNIKDIRLTTASGNITLKKGSGADVKVTVKHNYNNEDYKAILEQNGSRLTLKEEFGRGSFSGSSNWTLELPDNLDINANTGSGDIDVNGLSIEIKANSGSGDITLTSVNGEIDFNTGSGNMTLENVAGEVSLNTGSGDVRANKGKGNYQFNAGSGDIRVADLSGDFRINTGSGDVNAKSLAITGSSSFNTGSGNATVVLNGALNNDISVNSGSGDATLNFSGNAIAGEVTMTANKRNGEIVAPFKFDKEEEIEDGNSTRIRKTAKLGNKDIQIKVGTGSGTAGIVK